MSRDNKEGCRLPKKPIKVIPFKKEEDVKKSRLTDNHFKWLSNKRYGLIIQYTDDEEENSYNDEETSDDGNNCKVKVVIGKNNRNVKPGG